MKAFAITQCWCCQKMETHPILHGEEYVKQQEDMASRGWRRRSFGPPSWDKGPWFCSEECATESYNAKQAEDYFSEGEEAQNKRDEEFHKYCRETKITPFMWIIIAMIVLTQLIFWTRYLNQ